LLPVAGLFLAIDVMFVSANLHKIPDGGWFPLLVGALTLSLMLIWRRGRAVALARRNEEAMPIDRFIASLSRPHAPIRVPGTAVYLTTQQQVVPSALALNLKHNGVLHQHLLLLKVATERAPRVSEAARITVEELSAGIQWVELRFGFAEKPDVPTALRVHAEEIGCDPTAASFFIGREVPVPSLRPDVPLWQELIYAFMVRNAVSAPDYFLIAPQRVVETRDKGGNLSVLERSQKWSAPCPSPTVSRLGPRLQRRLARGSVTGACRRVTNLARLISKVVSGQHRVPGSHLSVPAGVLSSRPEPNAIFIAATRN
jgi:KUP system potassium uptake protein